MLQARIVILELCYWDTIIFGSSECLHFWTLGCDMAWHKTGVSCWFHLDVLALGISFQVLSKCILLKLMTLQIWNLKWCKCLSTLAEPTYTCKANMVGHIYHWLVDATHCRIAKAHCIINIMEAGYMRVYHSIETIRSSENVGLNCKRKMVWRQTYGTTWMGTVRRIMTQDFRKV